MQSGKRPEAHEYRCNTQSTITSSVCARCPLRMEPWTPCFCWEQFATLKARVLFARRPGATGQRLDAANDFLPRVASSLQHTTASASVRHSLAAYLATNDRRIFGVMMILPAALYRRRRSKAQCIFIIHDISLIGQFRTMPHIHLTPHIPKQIILIPSQSSLLRPTARRNRTSMAPATKLLVLLHTKTTTARARRRLGRRLRISPAIVER